MWFVMLIFAIENYECTCHGHILKYYYIGNDESWRKVHAMTFIELIFRLLISRKLWKLAQNCAMSWIDFDICHRTARLRMLCSITLMFVFKVKHVLLCTCNINCAVTVYVPGRFVSTRTAPSVELLLCVKQQHGRWNILLFLKSAALVHFDCHTVELLLILFP